MRPTRSDRQGGRPPSHPARRVEPVRPTSKMGKQRREGTGLGFGAGGRKVGTSDHQPGPRARDLGGGQKPAKVVRPVLSCGERPKPPPPAKLREPSKGQKLYDRVLGSTKPLEHGIGCTFLPLISGMPGFGTMFQGGERGANKGRPRAVGPPLGFEGIRGRDYTCRKHFQKAKGGRAPPLPPRDAPSHSQGCSSCRYWERNHQPCSPYGQSSFSRQRPGLATMPTNSGRGG